MYFTLTFLSSLCYNQTKFKQKINTTKMDDVKAKQQIVEKIQSSTNVLVTVSNSPTVDELSAAIGLTLLLDKLDKNTTTIFSGATPPAIEFLEPEKTFDDNTDSLRDFIVALNKDKADHLRYKVEGDLVRIYITPYKTKITQDDLEFSQGDYNVELVIALGVSNQNELDGALDAHGQILHDAAIITVTAGEQTSTLGGIDWHDSQTGSLSEMVAGLVDALKTDPETSLLDAPIATALLTGIVAETDRFSNTHTTAKTMNVASQLMAGGADQQLIASKLEESHEIGETAKESEKTEDQPQSFEAGGLTITHDSDETLEDIEKRVGADKGSEDTASEALVTPTPPPQIGQIADAYALDESDQATQLEQTTAPQAEAAAATDANQPAPAPSEPTAGGHAIITRSYLSPLSEGADQSGITGSVPESPASSGINPAYALDASEPAVGGPESSVPATDSNVASSEPAAPVEAVQPAAPGINPSGDAVVSPQPTTPAQEPVAPVAPPLDEDAALAAALAAPSQQVQPLAQPTAAPAATPSELGLPMPPPLPDFSAISAPASNPFDAQPVVSNDNPLPSGPNEGMLAPAQPDPVSAIGQSVPAPAPTPEPPIQPTIPPVPVTTTPGLNDPGQFQIPTQSNV